MKEAGGVGRRVRVGGAGDDRIGGAGADQLSGGAGADTFLFAKGDIGKVAAATDHILDFVRGQDRIDLSAIDANSANGAATNEAFTFIGTAAFTRHAGEVGYTVNGSDVYVIGDQNGDGKADFLFVVEHLTALSAADFVL